MLEFEKIASAVFEGNEDKVLQLVKRALSSGISAEDIIDKGLILGMDKVGQKFKAKEFYLPEVLMSGHAMKTGMEIVQPILSQKRRKTGETIVLGTVQDDVHDIGKNIVRMMIEGAGFHVVDLGVDVPAGKFIKAVKESNARILGLSSLLTTTMPRIKEVIQELKKAGLREKVIVVIGGAPITRAYAEQVGADGFAPNAAVAIDEIKCLIQRS